MILQPSNLAALRDALIEANRQGDKIGGINLSAFSRLLEHSPADMTATVETGLTLSALQSQLARRGQWLPLDPPNPERVTIADVLNGNLSGPRRFGYGTIREHLLGLQVVLADGRVIRNGGKVVKNVAGYDLCKLFVGARGSLGVILEATFKLRPLAEEEQFVAARSTSLARAGSLLETAFDSELTPVVFDLAGSSLILGFAGTREDVAWQLKTAASLGFTDGASLQHESEFWNMPAAAVRRVSVTPSRLIETVEGLGASQFIARAGNGVIYYRGGLIPPGPNLPVELTQRIKNTYDPNHILPELGL